MFPVVFYETAAGNRPVQEWIRSLPAANQRIIGLDLMKVQVGFPIGPPLCKSLGQGLWEVRSTLSNGVEARLLFCKARGTLVVVHGFFKKARKTPAQDLDLARWRKREFER
jgi:phage-related protein